MANRYPSPVKYLLFAISGIVTSFAVTYGTNLGWLSIQMMCLYVIFIIYFCVICRGDKVAIIYTISGLATSVIFLLAISLFNSVVGSTIGIITAYFIAFITDMIAKCDWRYLYFCDIDLESFPIERALQSMYDQHASVSDPTPGPSTTESKLKSDRQIKKSEKTPLSRKEQKAEAKKENKAEAKKENKAGERKEQKAGENKAEAKKENKAEAKKDEKAEAKKQMKDNKKS